MYQLVQTQAQLLSCLDMFRLFAVASLAVIPLVLLLRRPDMQFQVAGMALNQAGVLFLRHSPWHTSGKRRAH